MPRQPTGRPRGRPVGSGAILEREQVRLTVRIPTTLYNRLEAFAEGLHFTHGTPQLAGCVRNALEHFLDCPYNRQTENFIADNITNNGQTENCTIDKHIWQTDNGMETVSPISELPGDKSRQTTKHTEDQASIPTDKRIENRQTENSTEGHPETSEQQSDNTRQTENAPGYDHTRYQLGALCKRGHAYGDTGQSLRERRPGRGGIGDCVECHRERARASSARRQALRTTHKVNR